MAMCAKCETEIRRGDVYYVCDRCGKLICRIHGAEGSSCPVCPSGKLQANVMR